jgi:hypothetical protein
MTNSYDYEPIDSLFGRIGGDVGKGSISIGEFKARDIGNIFASEYCEPSAHFCDSGQDMVIQKQARDVATWSVLHGAIDSHSNSGLCILGIC